MTRTEDQKLMRSMDELRDILVGQAAKLLDLQRGLANRLNRQESLQRELTRTHEALARMTAKVMELQPAKEGAGQEESVAIAGGANPDYDPQWDGFCSALRERGIRLEIGTRRAIYEVTRNPSSQRDITPESPASVQPKRAAENQECPGRLCVWPRGRVLYINAEVPQGAGRQFHDALRELLGQFMGVGPEQVAAPSPHDIQPGERL